VNSFRFLLATFTFAEFSLFFVWIPSFFVCINSHPSRKPFWLWTRLIHDRYIFRNLNISFYILKNAALAHAYNETIVWTFSNSSFDITFQKQKLHLGISRKCACARRGWRGYNIFPGLYICGSLKSKSNALDSWRSQHCCFLEYRESVKTSAFMSGFVLCYFY